MPTGTTTRASRAVANTTATQSRRVASQAADEARDVASTAAEQGGALVQTAKDDARQIVQTVKERTSGLTGELASEGRSLVDDTRSQLQSQAQTGVQRIASGIRQLGEQTQAVAEGRPDEAPQLVDYLYRVTDGIYSAADRMFSVADDVETRGVTGVIDDIQSYARRRPGTFLLGAAVLGFGVGRLVKAEKARSEREEAEEQHVLTNNGNRRRPLAAGGTR